MIALLTSHVIHRTRSEARLGPRSLDTRGAVEAVSLITRENTLRSHFDLLPDLGRASFAVR